MLNVLINVLQLNRLIVKHFYAMLLSLTFKCEDVIGLFWGLTLLLTMTWNHKITYEALCNKMCLWNTDALKYWYWCPRSDSFPMNPEKRQWVSETGCLTLHATIFQLYMWGHMDVQVDWRRSSWTYGGLQTFWGFFNLPIQTLTRGQPFYCYSEKMPHFSHLLRHAWGYGGPILILNPNGPHSFLIPYKRKFSRGSNFRYFRERLENAKICLREKLYL